MVQTAHSGLSTKAWKIAASDAPILFDRYQILGILGEGGMGTVFKGYHLNLKRHVAIKTLRIDHRQSPEMVHRFLKEMASVGRMDHPNVVRASDAGEKNDVFYLVMDYLSGSDLARLVSRRGRLEPALACELTRQAALGLEYIHQTLIHRDIKPSNLMLTHGGVVKILDLGLARFGFGGDDDREKTPEGQAVGTYAYMAPEQAISGHAIDRRVDIYSLGCTFFRLLTGTLPYSGPEYDNAAKVISAHCNVSLQEVADFESIPKDLRHVVLKMMAKRPDDRYDSAREVVEALTPWCAKDADLEALIQSRAGELAEDTPVQPLPEPLPAEISRLTEHPADTPLNTPDLFRSTIGVAKLGRRGSRGLWMTGVCIAACVALPMLWTFLATTNRDPLQEKRAAPPVATVSSGWRDLDVLPSRQVHFLLAQRPFVLGGEPEDVRHCKWNEKLQVVDMIGGRKLFLVLGQTTKRRFTFEAVIRQAPWTGNLGIFWGYREDLKIKQDESYKKTGDHGPYFAWYQVLKLEGNSQRGFSIQRGKGSLRFNKEGDLATNHFWDPTQKIMAPVNGLLNLQIHVADDVPKLAFANGKLLDQLYSANAPPPESCQGALGLIALSHAGTFSDVRFTIQSNK